MGVLNYFKNVTTVYNSVYELTNPDIPNNELFLTLGMRGRHEGLSGSNIEFTHVCLICYAW